MENRTLNVESRTKFGKNVNRRLRNDGFIPAILYSHGETEALKVSAKEFFDIFKGYVSESVMLNLNFSGEEKMAFVKDYHTDPISGDMVHIDFFKVTLGETIQTRVPIILTGSPVGVKVGGVLEVGEREIEIECLPKDLVEEIEVSITELDLNETIHASDIQLEGSMQLISSPDTIIASIHPPRAVEEEETEEILEEGAAEAPVEAATEE